MQQFHVFVKDTEDTDAKEGALQAELYDLCAGSETEGLDGFLHWDGRRAADQGVFKKLSDTQSSSNFLKSCWRNDQRPVFQ